MSLFDGGAFAGRVGRCVLGCGLLLGGAWLAGLVTTPPAPPAQAAPLQQQPTPCRPRPNATPEIALWQPEYTASPLLPVDEGAVSVAKDGETLYLATETEVSRYRHGVWHSLGAPGDVSRIFAIAAADDGLWAAGLQGAAWRRDGNSGRWQRMSTGTAADLYAAAPDGNDAWAVGFDYEAEQGVIVHLSTSAAPAVYQTAALAKQQLYAVALDPAGERWVGGCNYLERPLVLRDRGRGAWEAVPVSLAKGCVYHLSFAPSGAGLAAAGTDLLHWDGATWQAAGVAPPEGAAWVRVAAQTSGEVAARALAGPASTEGQRSLASDPGLGGWALAGEPTWRGFVNGQAPWTTDGNRWAPGNVRPARQARRADETVYVALAGDTAGVAAFSRSALESQTSAPADLLRLADSQIDLAHPLVDRIGQNDRNADIASGGPDASGERGSVWVGARGALPFIGRPADNSADWQPATAELFDTTGVLRMQLVDFAGPKDGWAAGVMTGTPGAKGALWRWDGRFWQGEPVPPGLAAGSPQLRALPGGRAWALGSGRHLAEFDPQSHTWQPHADWPEVVAPPVIAIGGITTTRIITGLLPLVAPFDATNDAEGRSVGWLAAVDGFYRIDGQGTKATVTRTQDPVRGVVTDLQLVTDARGLVGGWAMALDPAPSRRQGEYSAVLLRLTKAGRWEEVNRLPDFQCELQLPTLADLEWRLMAAVSTEEVWLFGELKPAGLRVNTVLLRYHAARGWTTISTCNVAAMSAQAVDVGTDLWLVGGNAGCQPRQGPAGGNGAGRLPDPMPLAPIVSRILLHREVGRVYLPRAWR